MVLIKHNDLHYKFLLCYMSLAHMHTHKGHFQDKKELKRDTNVFTSMSDISKATFNVDSVLANELCVPIKQNLL